MPIANPHTAGKRRFKPPARLGTVARLEANLSPPPARHPQFSTDAPNHLAQLKRQMLDSEDTARADTPGCTFSNTVSINVWFRHGGFLLTTPQNHVPLCSMGLANLGTRQREGSHDLRHTPTCPHDDNISNAATGAGQARRPSPT